MINLLELELWLIEYGLAVSKTQRVIDYIIKNTRGKRNEK